jgi:hypothetical protein
MTISRKCIRQRDQINAIAASDETDRMILIVVIKIATSNPIRNRPEMEMIPSSDPNALPRIDRALVADRPDMMIEDAGNG